MNRLLYASRWSIINKNPHTAATRYQRGKQLSTYQPLGLSGYRARSAKRILPPISEIPLSSRIWSRTQSNMSGDDMDDPALKAAIEASLRDIQGPGDEQNAGPSGSQRKVVDLTADSDGDGDDDDVVEVYPKSKEVISPEDEEEVDADLKRAIELSIQDAQCPEASGEDDDDPKGKKAKPSSVESDKKPSPIQKTEQSTPSQSIGIAGLDRKQMEQERLARLAKRKAEDIPTEQREAKHQRTEPEPSKSSIKVRSKTEKPTATPSIQFPTGAVKKTWNTNSLRTGDDITIEEVLQSSDVEFAVLSSFMWDTEWLFEKFNIPTTKFIMIMQAKEESTKRQYESETATMRNLRLCFPPMEGQVNCMHSKLMLLFHPSYVRIVVPTANLTPFDWGCTRDSLENSVFLIDLPKKTSLVSESPRTAFHEELAYFLKASTLHENMIAKLDNFDFSQTAHIAFVHTIGGSHVGESWRRTGYCGLGRAVESLGLRTSKPVNIDYVTSSLGSLNDEFLRSIYLAAQGDNGLTEYTHRTNKPPSKTPPASEWKNNRFRVYFPSQTTVDESPGGPASAGTICFQSRWYEGAKFPREILRDCESSRRYLLMHNKIIYIRPDEPITLPDNNTCPAWAYIGSANLSESAWGRLVQDRSAKAPKLNCRNWECGVVVPVLGQGEGRVLGGDEANAETGSKAVDTESPTALNVFDGTVPVPMILPGKRYGGARKPWYFMD